MNAIIIYALCGAAFWVGIYTKLDKPFSPYSATWCALFFLAWPLVTLFYVGTMIGEYILEAR